VTDGALEPPTDQPEVDQAEADQLGAGRDRRMLIVTHTGRAGAVSEAAGIIRQLVAAGIEVALLPSEADALDDGERGIVVVDPDRPSEGCELVVCLGGDGTILRGAELARDSGVPVLGVNLGHVGFLAEAEHEEIGLTVERLVARDYDVEERMAIDVAVSVGGTEVTRSWALNEATVEKAARERMLELVVEVDGRPLSTIGCDGAVMATPTGSTAYGFSAGGPVIWPEVEALLFVPISAHALFARPLVVSPRSRLAVEVLEDTEGSGVLWCDGRRMVELPPGARIEVTRSAVPVRLARLTRAPFTDRLVAKFDLPVTGWRGGRAPRG
jgi:NAD+ kinase